MLIATYYEGCLVCKATLGTVQGGIGGLQFMVFSVRYLKNALKVTKNMRSDTMQKSACILYSIWV
jgi:uncharacterized protein (DUF486 family)